MSQLAMFVVFLVMVTLFFIIANIVTFAMWTQVFAGVLFRIIQDRFHYMLEGSLSMLKEGMTRRQDAQDEKIDRLERRLRDCYQRIQTLEEEQENLEERTAALEPGEVFPIEESNLPLGEGTFPANEDEEGCTRPNVGVPGSLSIFANLGGPYHHTPSPEEPATEDPTPQEGELDEKIVSDEPAKECQKPEEDGSEQQAGKNGTSSTDIPKYIEPDCDPESQQTEANVETTAGGMK